MAERLWFHDNGNLSCDNCGGNYLRSAIVARPKAKSHSTPLGTWRLWTAAHEAEWVRTIGTPATCEGCDWKAKQREEVNT